MSIKIIRPGLLSTIQDLGRQGFQKHGVIVGGAMDRYASRLANMLVGNEEGEGTIEMTLVGPSIEFEQDMLISMTGGNFSPTIDDEKAPMWRPIYVKKGSVLTLNVCESGCRAYLAVAGGFNIKKVMESKSTYLLGNIGGYKGRALQKNDRLYVNEMSSIAKKIVQKVKFEADRGPFIAPKWCIPSSYIPQAEPVLRFVEGKQFDQFSQQSIHDFCDKPFDISQKSDRMGYRLTGPKLNLKEPMELLSEAVSHGTVQVPPNGDPIVLLADRQTTGGYPKIAQVISVDLPIIAQLKPGEQVYFRKIDFSEAEALLLEQEKEIDQLKYSIKCYMQ
ncbi:5-oxoprolinase/urea amidolyase family protein [Terrilactibacillus sp. BCM23-1]|uniref:5-oxoprolinase/urea amidolyase family protein n=1 Tax=Terrilactibacillus tamarindi TaxID=2599694 RepID=A0A6N8CRP3_9BACI|nr:biotin-dependent carboxyltransferase family protein [Terrilactibacillus tamarindi]MTT31867.1 5-oxoprolinase/urea amidolyase family protein [Terrilactibacillus tamarindi]